MQCPKGLDYSCSQTQARCFKAICFCFCASKLFCVLLCFKAIFCTFVCLHNAQRLQLQHSGVCSSSQRAAVPQHANVQQAFNSMQLVYSTKSGSSLNNHWPSQAMANVAKFAEPKLMAAASQNSVLVSPFSSRTLCGYIQNACL